MLNINNLDKKANIDFPCEWTYKVLGSDKILVENAIKEVLNKYPYKIIKTTKSSKGNYISLTVKLTVFSHDELENLFNNLANHPDIKIVL